MRLLTAGKPHRLLVYSACRVCHAPRLSSACACRLILETDAATVASRVAMRGAEDGPSTTEQVCSAAPALVCSMIQCICATRIVNSRELCFGNCTLLVPFECNTWVWLPHAKRSQDMPCSIKDHCCPVSCTSCTLSTCTWPQ